MRKLLTLLLLSSSTACAQKTAGSAASGSGSATPSAPAEPRPPAAPPAAGSSASAPASESDSTDEVAQLVVHDVGSKALGSQKIEASCVSVSLMPSGKWTVAAARLKDCGDKTARSILWLYKRADNGKWSEDYVGQPPRCWKGVPADIADAVTKATLIPGC
ncbi:MAG TPA: hypothetical protein VL326_07635 [Kofleriaceae bacterium]|nr:hypothetical protein [Kofleriaceae bacterium]